MWKIWIVHQSHGIFLCCYDVLALPFHCHKFLIDALQIALCEIMMIAEPLDFHFCLELAQLSDERSWIRHTGHRQKGI